MPRFVLGASQGSSFILRQPYKADVTQMQMGKERLREVALFVCDHTEKSRPRPSLVPALPLTCCVTWVWHRPSLVLPFSISTRKAGLDLLYRLRQAVVYLPAWTAFCLEQKCPPQAQTVRRSHPNSRGGCGTLAWLVRAPHLPGHSGWFETGMRSNERSSLRILLEKYHLPSGVGELGRWTRGPENIAWGPGSSCT